MKVLYDILVSDVNGSIFNVKYADKRMTDQRMLDAKLGDLVARNVWRQ